MQSTAEVTARGAIEKEIKHFEEMRDDQDQAIATMREEIDERETARHKYAGVIDVLKRSLKNV